MTNVLTAAKPNSENELVNDQLTLQNHLLGAKSQAFTESPTSEIPAAEPLHKHERRLRGVVLTLEVITGFSAMVGAVGLMTNGMGMSDSALSHLPTDSWVLPGLALLVIVGIPNLIGAALIARVNEWRSPISITAGLLLMGWVAVELIAIHQFHILQLIFFVAGAAIAILARVEQVETFDHELAIAE